MDLNSSQSSSPTNLLHKKKRMISTTHNTTLTNQSVNHRSRSTLNQEDPVIKL